MVQKYQKWVLAGGCCLAFLAAAVNTSYLMLAGVTVSHLTGDLSKFAVETIGEAGKPVFTGVDLALVLVGFVLGAALNGFLIDTQDLALARPYGRTTSFIGCLLWISASVIDNAPGYAVFLASFACGVQNALASHYRGMILRTTHITGLLTDFGALVGMKLRGRFVPIWKCIIPLLLSLSFFLGAGFGVVLSLAFHTGSLFILSAVYFFGGLGWSLIKRMVFGPNHPGLKVQACG